MDEKQTLEVPLFKKREDFLQGLERFLSAVNTSGSCSIEINASWGYGKTTFLCHAEKELRGKGFGVLHYNAWENDYETDPLNSIYQEFVPQLYGLLGINKQSKGNEIKAISTFIAGSLAFLQIIAPAMNTNGVVSAVDNFKKNQKSIEKKISKLSTIEQGQGESPSAKAKGDIQRSLREIYGAFIKRQEEQGQESKPIVVLVDELDRCRPDYAIELLERIKHLFSVNGYVFVFALARDQLEKSVKHRYGEEFDASGYLERFFDFRFRLPDPELAEYFDLQMTKTKLPEGGRCAIKYLQSFVMASPDGFGLSLRVLDKMIIDLSSLIAFVDDYTDIRIWALFLALGIFIRERDEKSFSAFFGRNVIFDENKRVYNDISGVFFIQYRSTKYSFSVSHDSCYRLFVKPEHTNTSQKTNDSWEHFILYVGKEPVSSLNEGIPFGGANGFDLTSNPVIGMPSNISFKSDSYLEKYSDIRQKCYLLINSVSLEARNDSSKAKEPS